MADIYNYIVNTGVIVPDTSDLKNDVTAEYQEALGSDMNTTAGTPQGRLITAETAARANVVRTNSLTANMFNINLAYGKALDALGAMFGLYREGGDLEQRAGDDNRRQRHGHPGKLPSQYGEGSYFLP